MSIIVFAGDSVTQGAFVMNPDGTVAVGLPANQTFAHIVGMARGFTSVINAGKSGDTSTWLVQRLQADVLSLNPDAVCICIGINDVCATNPTPVNVFKANLSCIVERVQQAGAKATLLTPSLVRSSTAGVAFPPYLDAIEEVAAERACPLVPVYDLFCRKWLGVAASTEFDALFYDYKHPSAYGHQFIASCILKEQFADACTSAPT